MPQRDPQTPSSSRCHRAALGPTGLPAGRGPSGSHPGSPRGQGRPQKRCCRGPTPPAQHLPNPTDNGLLPCSSQTFAELDEDTNAGILAAHKEFGLCL